MKYAIVKSGGKQYRMTEGVTVIVDKVEGQAGSQFIFDEVMLYRNGETVEIGTPFLPNIAVIGKLSETKKGEKIRVAKFKAKVRYRKVMGFRPLQSHIIVEKIVTKNIKKEKPKKQVIVKPKVKKSVKKSS